MHLMSFKIWPSAIQTIDSFYDSAGRINIIIIKHTLTRHIVVTRLHKSLQWSYAWAGLMYIFGILMVNSQYCTHCLNSKSRKEGIIW